MALVFPTCRDWSPDGKQIVVILERNDRTVQIALVSAADGSTRILKSLEWRWPSRLEFSPDGRYIVYDPQVRSDSVERDILLISADGSCEATLVAGAGNDSHPVWTPEGKKVLFFTDRTGTPGLWSIDVRDGKPRGSPELLKASIGAASPLGITRNGALYYALRTGMEDIYTAEIDPETGRIVAPPVRASERFVGSNIGPVFSPDGQYLAYHSRRGSVRYGPGALVIVVRSLKTGDEREFPSRLNQLGGPVSWFPDSKAFLVLAQDSDRRHVSLYRLELGTGSFSLIRRTDWAAGRRCRLMAGRSTNS